MNVDTVSLYTHFGIAAPENAAGILKMWIPETPAGIPARCRPAALILPGGGYAYVSPREAEPVALRLMAAGYACFVLEYSCAPHPYPVALREAAMAMKYIRQNAAKFGISGNMVAAIGFSAGGHLCGMLGMCYDDALVADIADGALLRPDALGLCYPVAVSWGRTHEASFQNLACDDAQLRRNLSLEKHVRSDMPPVFLWHTRQDTSVPCRNSLVLAAELEEKGVPFALHIYHKGPHGLSVADETAYPAEKVPEVSADVRTWPETMIEFFREQGFRIGESELRE